MSESPCFSTGFYRRECSDKRKEDDAFKRTTPKLEVSAPSPYARGGVGFVVFGGNGLMGLDGVDRINRLIVDD